MTLDHRDSLEALVHKDLRLSFDGNRYCVPPRYVGRRLTVKADSSSVAIYDQQQEIHARGGAAKRSVRSVFKKTCSHRWLQPSVGSSTSPYRVARTGF